MKKEELFEGFGALDDALLKRSEQGGTKMNKNVSKFIRYGSIAACLAIVLGAGAFWINGNQVPDTNIDSENNVVVESSDNNSQKQDDVSEEDEKFVDVNMLLASNEGISEEALRFEKVNLGEYSAIYHKVESVESSILKESAGSEVEGTEGWHRVLGHNDMQYLIWDNENEYSLWVFSSFQSENYPYKDVLQMVYNVHSAEDITEIIVAPASMDNSDEGKKLQSEIGTWSITDRETINSFYDILSGLTCYGSGQWDMIGLGDDTPVAMQNQVSAGRYLTLITSQGIKLDSMKYTAISGMFYEYEGVAYSALSADEKAIIEEILNIELHLNNEEITNTEVEANEITNIEENEIDSTVVDVPVDETNYSDARDYSAELMDLQNRITQAMINKELPFVTSSGIRENPDRLHVTVTTTDAALIEKLKAFDTTGELLEIEYSDSVVSFG